MVIVVTPRDGGCLKKVLTGECVRLTCSFTIQATVTGVPPGWGVGVGGTRAGQSGGYLGRWDVDLDYNPVTGEYTGNGTGPYFEPAVPAPCGDTTEVTFQLKLTDPNGVLQTFDSGQTAEMTCSSSADCPL